MDSDFSASASGKQQFSSGNDPQGSAIQQQIQALEQQEQQRFEREKQAMDAEEQEVRDALKVKEVDAEKALREEAKKELTELKGSEVADIVQTAKEEAQKREEALESTYEKNAAKCIDELVEQCIDFDFSTAA